MLMRPNSKGRRIPETESEFAAGRPGMNIEKLVRMANQIASFFRSYPEDQAVRGIHDHLVAFWTPNMRAALLAHVNQGCQGLDSLVTKALLTFPDGKNPIEKEIAGPEQVGELGSDAG
jgi:formate dehydrogenase subunit delta